MPKFLDLTGHKYHRLTVLHYSRKQNQKTMWLCQCDCGNKVEVSTNNLRHKKNPVKSCGCFKIDKMSTHGMTGSKIFSIWEGMKIRCKYPNTNSYERYGGRGIKVCERWMTFENFYADMYPTYVEGLTLDRIDVNGDYCPDNCRWVTQKEQANNRTNNRILEYKGKKYTMKELAEYANINYGTFQARLKLGWSVERAVEEPVNEYKTT